MSLTERKEIDRIEIVDKGIIQLRQATIVEREGELVAKTYHRWMLTPDMDISDQEQKVQDIANVAWTPEVKAAYAAFKVQQEANKL